MNIETTEPEEPATESHPWSRRAQDIGAVVWSSFLAACFGTFLFFGFFDPTLLGDDQHPPKWLSDRMTGYAVGFFFFWIVSLVAASLTTFLVESRPADRVQR